MENVLTVKDLSIKIKDRTLIQNASFNIKQGEAVLLSGPNGVGKSSLLKAILRLETDHKDIRGEIIVHKFGDVLKLNSAELQRYRSSIAYVQQKDEYSQMGNIQVRDIINESDEPHSGKTLSSAEVNALIDKWIPRNSSDKRIFDAKSKPAKFSGGEQRLLSVLSVIATRANAELFIIDEPLNNLDFVNARNISNLINTIIKKNPSAALLMISHCRIFPFINRELRLTRDGIEEVTDRYVCHSCFGEHDSDGFY